MSQDGLFLDLSKISEGVIVTFLSAFLNSNDNDITLSFLPISVLEKDKRYFERLQETSNYR